MKIEYIIVKEKTEISSIKSTFIKLLETNNDISIDDGVITYSDCKADFVLTSEESDDKSEIIFHLIIESDTEVEKDLKNLNAVSRGIRKTVKETGHPFHFNTIWDETSQHYCEKSYPRINTVENLMRKLIFQFMLKSIGSKWIKEAFPIKLKQKISRTAEKNDVENFIKDSLYLADFIQLIELLFEKYTKVQSVAELFSKLEKVEEIEELEKLRELRPRSNWERYFSDLIEFENLNDTWVTLYKYRNTVAHNKLISKSDYEEIIKLTNLVKEKLNQALEEIDDIEIPEEEKEDISSFTSKSMQSTQFWSDHNKADLASNDAFVAGSLAIHSQKCRECYKTIDFTSGISIDGLCEECRLNNTLSAGIQFDRRCNECGKSIENDFVFGFSDDLCSSCRIKTQRFTVTNFDNQSLLNQNFATPNYFGMCKNCGKLLPVGSTETYCKDCEK
ncbi:MAG: hypothetical protein WD267_06550 [Balneolales bacterium]